jgi:hypothetical protein
MAKDDEKSAVAPVPSPVQSDKRTPEEWTGPCGQRRSKRFEDTVSKINGKEFDVIGDFLWEHEAASALHGWASHAHHAGEPIKLTRADYEAALSAAGKTNTHGEYEPHPAALSPHAPKRTASVKGA